MGYPRLRVILPSLLLASLLVSSTAVAASPRHGGGAAAATTTTRPDTYGIDSYSVTSISDLAFSTFDSGLVYSANQDDYFRYLTSAGGGAFVTGATIPAGAVIDYVGLGSCDVPGGSWIVNLYEVNPDGTFVTIAGVPSGAHGAGTPCYNEYNATALNYLIQYNAYRTLQVEVFQTVSAPTDGSARFSGVEIWWHRAVSPAPAVATFNDVPTSHPFFQFIEALAASGITGGCGGGNYCPDAPLTRGQMAVFLSKALGLHFPAVPPG